MRSCERFRETMALGRPDRPPLLEEGVREDVLSRWRQEGLGADETPADHFTFDPLEQVSVSLDPIPAPEHPLTTSAGLEDLAGSLDADDPDRLPKTWHEGGRGEEDGDAILTLPVHRGFFRSLGVEGWSGFAEVIYALRDAPGRVMEAMRLCGEFHAGLADRVLEGTRVDAAILSEPMGGNDGPLLSPRDYRRFVLESYQPLLRVLRGRGVDTVILQTYGDVASLIPDLLEAGIQCLWAIEVRSNAVDYLALRRRFGTDLRLIGGIDLDALLEGPEAIRREIDRRVPALLEGGGYIPLADGRVRGNMPWAHYGTYRRLLEARVSGG